MAFVKEPVPLHIDQQNDSINSSLSNNYDEILLNIEEKSNKSASISRSRSSSTSSQASDAFTPVTSKTRRAFMYSDVDSASDVPDETTFSVDNVSKEELYQFFRKMEHRCAKYKARFRQVLDRMQEYIIIS